ncbi:MAG TPA: DUF2079 domain-containing protein [Trebonia sp.]|nr:DUF2079 domain-containing protein [Trebonia sp.]
MSEPASETVPTAVGEQHDSRQRDSGQHGAGAAPHGGRLLGRVRRAGYVLLGLQLAGFLAWSVFEYQRFSLTADYSQYNQAWFLVAHGNLDPYGTVGGIRFWQNDAEFMPWLLAPLYWVFRSGLVLPWVQDLSVVGAELVAFAWLCDLARRRCAEREAAWLAGLGLLLLVASPWLWWTVSFDVHEEPLVIVFAVLMARDLSQGRRRAWVWAVPVLLGGAPTTTYVLGIGLGGVLAGPRTRPLGARLAAAGFGYSLFLGAVHGNGAAAGAIHSYLSLASGHPFRLVQVLWDGRADIVANLAPGGLLGIGMPVILPLALAVIVPDTLSGSHFGEPLFQNVPLYVLVPVGTVAVLAWLLARYRRHRRAVFALAGLLAAQAVGWAVVWGPQTPGEWVRVSGAEAATLASVQARIPASAEVIASQGVLGRFSGRTSAYPLFSVGQAIPLQPGTWFVITPDSGIESVTPAVSMALVGELAGPLHATLVTHANGVWAFRLNPPPGLRVLRPPGDSAPLAAWTAGATAGRPVLSGPVSGWHLAATGSRGYVADGLEWLENPGRYTAEVTLSAAGTVNVEAWDDTTGTLLARRTVSATGGIRQVGLPVTAPDAGNAGVFSGLGPFHADFDAPPPGQRIEVRVWTPGGAAVNVYSAMLTAAPGTAPRP